MVASSRIKFFTSALLLPVFFLLLLLSSCTENNDNQEIKTQVNLVDSMRKGMENAEVILEDFEFRKEKIALIVLGYMAKFSTREFWTLQEYYADQVETFINLKNIQAKRVSEEAKRYFSDKKAVSFFVDEENLQYDIQGNRCTVQAKATIGWVKQTNPRDTVMKEEGYELTLVDVMAFSSPVLVEIVFDEEYKIRSYVEKEIIHEKIQLPKTITVYSRKDKSHTDIPTGTWIGKGEFSSYVMALDGFGVLSEIRQKIYFNEQPYWANIQDLQE